MNSDDAERVAKLDRKCFNKDDAWDREWFRIATTIPSYEFMVAELDGKLIGCAGYELDDYCAEVQSLAIDPDYRGKGIGTLLFMKMIIAAVDRGAEIFLLEVRPSNTAAVKLYKSFGFEVVDRLENFYGNEDALVMRWEV
jgi:ribosomal-protein-alanine N-acetyltransferase